MTIGEHITILRKRKGLSQSGLGKHVGTSGDVIGRYERSVITPSIDVIIKIADALEISVDYLVGKTSLELDKHTLERLEEISNLPKEKKDYVIGLIDMCLRDFRTRQSYSN